MSCSFLVTDARQYDCPIVVALYTSPQYFDMMQIVFGGMLCYETYVDMTEYAIYLFLLLRYTYSAKKTGYA